ncbi:MBL fold metallo-hydrolase [Romeria aff. gracilis LEGE 07310]|uniref:MBL fold metallo-hydrolase n=1 Tax=Vasconcelosia minhoensis LEGE 07310 TaxID=915328 RepID=A0A8J7ALB5_9CYAN|nr:MBL fold metallo-hydrolase [Romeria gracilis]MBE9076276.1 MBL fold metallo-hydrolase [Romeria aff. gracilis LEGE 07310]
MAHLKDRRPQNVEGDFYVDSTCIDCDTCRWMAPQVFSRADGMSAVHHQPRGEERVVALQALLSCPTASIGTVEKPSDIRQAQRQLPLRIADSVYHCGYHSDKSYGAGSYFIQRPEGNVLVDSPRFTPPLVKQLEALGGVRYMYLTHCDDVADHAKFQAHFGCDRVLHQADISPATRSVEIQLSGDAPISLAEDLLILPVRGHTKGHTVLLYNNKFLFTGDHLAWSAQLEQLYAFRRYCWYSWTQQLESMRQLANYSFEWVLPGHGRRYHADPQTMQAQMQRCLDWMKSA